MTDRELLEAAAKAAGIVGAWKSKANPSIRASNGPDTIDGFFIANPRGGYGKLWNPLADDGDALRLANNRQLDIRHANGKVHAGFEGEFWCTEGWFPNGDKNAATRRAITRAAAATLERGMP